MSALDLQSTYLRLRPDGSAEKLPVGADFWPNLIAGKLGDFHHEYLVSTMFFDQAWSSWETHPNGDEIVVLLSGAVDFIMETAAGNQTVELRKPGEYALVPKGTSHTANPRPTVTLLFITAGEGTTHRPR